MPKALSLDTISVNELEGWYAQTVGKIEEWLSKTRINGHHLTTDVKGMRKEMKQVTLGEAVYWVLKFNGRDVLSDPHRLVGCLLDIAPEGDETITAFERNCDEKLLGMLLEAMCIPSRQALDILERHISSYLEDECFLQRGVATSIAVELAIALSYYLDVPYQKSKSEQTTVKVKVPEKTVATEQKSGVEPESLQNGGRRLQRSGIASKSVRREVSIERIIAFALCVVCALICLYSALRERMDIINNTQDDSTYMILNYALFIEYIISTLQLWKSSSHNAYIAIITSVLNMLCPYLVYHSWIVDQFGTYFIVSDYMFKVWPNEVFAQTFFPYMFFLALVAIYFVTYQCRNSHR